MKKSLLAVILAVAMVAPVFAQKGDMSINGKLGLGVSNNLNYHANGYHGMPDGLSQGYDMEMPISIGAEFFYGLMDMLSVGAGINYNFGSNSKANMEGSKPEAKTVNFYLAVKPEAKIESDIFTSLYLIGQIGGSSIIVEANGKSETADMGIYLGFGAGTIIKDCVIVELLISSANGSLSINGNTADLQYTATTINVGYKFAL
ncbi:MAG: outer membrane beta-barrel protein [Elusimicrobia bacterium]|nr:outer membrane beta-barrel protein [Elusimicrobiota bacterium]